MILLFHLRSRKVERLAQGHTGNMWQSWDLNRGRMKVKSVHGSHYAVAASPLSLPFSFHPALSFSNGDRRWQKDLASLSSNWTQSSRARSLPSQLIFLFQVWTWWLWGKVLPEVFSSSAFCEASAPANVNSQAWVIPLFLFIFYYNHFSVKPNCALEFGLTLHIIFGLIIHLAFLICLSKPQWLLYVWKDFFLKVIVLNLGQGN